MVESNALFNYHSFVKIIKSIPHEKLDSIGRTSFSFRDYDCEKGMMDTYNEEFFMEGHKQEKEMIAKLKNVRS